MVSWSQGRDVRKGEVRELVCDFGENNTVERARKHRGQEPAGESWDGGVPSNAVGQRQNLWNPITPWLSVFSEDSLGILRPIQQEAEQVGHYSCFNQSSPCLVYFIFGAYAYTVI